ncbi:hypothetical protein J6590_040627 [Homalodisca vitripennis]|nr:hypothetical protein J6590_040627 [Homalodisca vitripennis]
MEIVRLMPPGNFVGKKNKSESLKHVTVEAECFLLSAQILNNLGSPYTLFYLPLPPPSRKGPLLANAVESPDRGGGCTQLKPCSRAKSRIIGPVEPLLVPILLLRVGRMEINR